ncbi:DUF721 domain-containing protein [Bounagaea algeriensis]
MDNSARSGIARTGEPDTTASEESAGQVGHDDSGGQQGSPGRGAGTAESATDLSEFGDLQGPDLARAALQAARERSSRNRAARRDSRPRVRTGQRKRRGWSGARSDDRDPQALGRLASRLVSERGWGDRIAGGRVFAGWAGLVGADVAAHTQPVSLQDGVLTVRAESTAWATQLRLLQRQLLGRIADGVGQDVVRKIRVQGPAAPSWRHGPRHVRGRGPRDTYG